MDTSNSFQPDTINSAVQQTVELCLKAARATSSHHEKSLEGILRMLYSYRRNFTQDSAALANSVDYLTHINDQAKINNLFSASKEASVSTSAEDFEDFIVHSPPSTEPEIDKFPEALNPTLKHRTWSPPKFIRERIDRRYSGDIIEHTINFNNRCRQLRRSIRRRKSFTEESIINIARQEMEYIEIRHNTSHPYMKNHRIYRRCRSALLAKDLSEMHDVPPVEITRKHSLSSIFCGSGSAGEVWPESITALLTGNQTLIDRYLLFEHLEQLLNQKESSNGTTELHSLSNSYSTGTSVKRISGLRLWSHGVSIPRPDKKWGGEDAYFTCDESDGFLGVADGVGEWGELGCNPRQFAEELMAGAKQKALDLKYTLNKKLITGASQRAKVVLRAGFYVTKSFGASTSIIAGLNETGSILGIANIGDSSCLLLRRESKRHRQFVAYRRTKEQQHFFNCPYQLSRIPRPDDFACLASQGKHRLVQALSNFGWGYEADTPDMADLYDISVQEGDIIVLATDGVFDNLFDQEIANLISLAISPHEARILDSIVKESNFSCHPSSILPPDFDPHHGIATPPYNIAKAIAEAAYYRSMDTKARTPFGNQSRKDGRFHQGGKMDDITVVVSWII